MISPCLPGVAPPMTRDNFHRLPKRAMGLTKAEEAIYFHVVDNLEEDGACPDKIPEISARTGLHIGTVGPIIRRMAREHPPGLDHPYFRLEGGTRDRRIRPLILPKDAPNKQPAIRMKNHSNPAAIRMKNHSNWMPEIPENQGLESAGPLFEGIEEKTHVDMISIPPEGVACACEGEPDAPAGMPVIQPAPANAREAPAAAPGPDGIDREVAELMKLPVDELRRRLAEAEVRTKHPNPAVRFGALGERGLLEMSIEGLEGRPTPPPAPKVGSLDPRRAVAPAAKPAAPAPAPHVETPDLIRRLISPAGPDQVDAIVARLCEKLDPEFAPLYRRCCADVIAGRLDVGAMIGGFRWALNAPGRGVKKGPSFAAYIAQYRETRLAAQGPGPRPHRRE